jgi:hypothetical protein
MNDASNAETYLKWVQVYICVLGEKNLCAPHDVATVDRKKLLKEFRKFSKVPKKEVAENKVKWEVELAPIKVKCVEANAIHKIPIHACYDLLHQLLADDPVTNGTASPGKSTKRTPGPYWTDRRTGDYG